MKNFYINSKILTKIFMAPNVIFYQSFNIITFTLQAIKNVNFLHPLMPYVIYCYEEMHFLTALGFSGSGAS